VFHLSHSSHYSDLRVGVTAHYCGICHDWTVFDVYQRLKRDMVVIVPVGRNQIVLWLAKCRQCGLLISQSEHFKFASDVDSRGIDSLIRQTNPDLYKESANYVEIANRMRQRKLQVSDRLFLAQTSIRILDVMSQTLTYNPASASTAVVVALAITALIVGVTIMFVIHGGAIVEFERTTEVALISILLGGALLFLAARNRSAILNRRILPLLRRALTPLGINARELSEAIATLASEGIPLARQLKKHNPETLIGPDISSGF